MKKLLIITLIGLFISSNTAFAYTKKYIKNSKGQTVGYTKNYSNGKTVQHNKKGQVEYIYKTDSTGKITKYSKTGKKLGTYK